MTLSASPKAALIVIPKQPCGLCATPWRQPSNRSPTWIGMRFARTARKNSWRLGAPSKGGRRHSGLLFARFATEMPREGPDCVDSQFIKHILMRCSASVAALLRPHLGGRFLKSWLGTKRLSDLGWDRHSSGKYRGLARCNASINLPGYRQHLLRWR